MCWCKRSSKAFVAHPLQLVHLGSAVGGYRYGIWLNGRVHFRGIAGTLGLHCSIPPRPAYREHYHDP